MNRIIDISPAIEEGIAVWPGDVPFSRQISLDMKHGDGFTLSDIHTTLHLGAHADASNHYRTDGVGIGEHGLGAYIGPCQVIHVDVDPSKRIMPEMVKTEILAPRVLFHTGTYPDPRVFNEDFASLSPELITWLHGQDVVLIGIDTPSIDPFDDKVLLSHDALGRCQIANLEGLILGHVVPGPYTLVALPLPLVHCDASPVRAVLIDGSLPSGAHP
jgi:arylformamidase